MLSEVEFNLKERVFEEVITAMSLSVQQVEEHVITSISAVEPKSDATSMKKEENLEGPRAITSIPPPDDASN